MMRGISGMLGLSGMLRISGMSGQTSSVIPFWNHKLKQLRFIMGISGLS
jgi:hypothetical protein